MRTARRYMLGLAIAAAVGLVGASGAMAADGPSNMCAGKSFCVVGG
ncbi:hypothetical protein [Intrasporangium flavum]|nr:hypothetical protein [Intrasporangium flavum]